MKHIMVGNVILNRESNDLDWGDVTNVAAIAANDTTQAWTLTELLAMPELTDKRVRVTIEVL